MSWIHFAAVTYALDYNGFCLLNFSPSADGSRLFIHLDVPETTVSPLLDRLVRQLAIELDGRRHALRPVSPFRAELALEPAPHARHELSLLLAGQTLARTRFDGAHMEPLLSLLPKLTVSELRLMGEYERFTPYARYPGMEPAGIVFSDFHTHSSGELPGSDLIALAQAHDIPYPVRLLQALKIGPEALPAERVMARRVVFPPLQMEEAHLPEEEEAVSLRALAPSAVARLAQAMDAPFDRQGTLGDMELSFYRFRYPLSKRPELIAPTLEKIGENYARAGVRYAEITMNGLDRPENIDAVHRAVPLVKARYGVDLRFLVGVPRTYGKTQLHSLIEKIKILAESPYIVGADIIGYETNKTSHMMEELESLAAWIKAHGQEDFTLRVHAGENAKNPDNVYEVFRLAQRREVRVRVGHAIYGLDEKTLDLAERLSERGLITIEFNPDSNIAMNNIDRLDQIRFHDCLRRGIPFVVGSDSSGINGTSAVQLGLQMLFSNLRARDIRHLKDIQEILIDRQLAYSETKRRRVLEDFPEFEHEPCRFVAQLLTQCDAVAAQPSSKAAAPALAFLNGRVQLAQPFDPARFDGRTPVLLVGASGNSWKRISLAERREVAIAIDMLVQALDPERAYFVNGRAKKEGVVAQLAHSLKELDEPFDVLGIITAQHLAEQQRGLIEGVAPHLTHILRIDSSFLQVPDTLVDMAGERDGIVIAAGGAAFTRDVILKARHRHLPILLMRGAEGAARDKAEVLDERETVADARDLLARLYAMRPELFREPLTAAAIERFYHYADRRLGYQPAILEHDFSDASVGFPLADLPENPYPAN